MNIEDTYLVCTDLDRTLLPNGTQPESAQARQLFSRLVAAPNVLLAFVSGRDRKLIEQAIKTYQLPAADFVIGDVGTSIYDMRVEPWTIWNDWHEEIGTDWPGYDHLEIIRLLRDVKQLRLQEHSKQNTYKVSYYFPLHLDRQRCEAEIEQRLAGHQLKTSLTWSVDEPTGIGLLDVLPRRASKLHALEFLIAQLGISRNNLIFAGDSGNDLAVLASSIPAVLVANAAPSVVKATRDAASEAGTSDCLYIAKGGFLGMNGNYSAGILEGVHHFHPELATIFAPGELR